MGGLARAVLALAGALASVHLTPDVAPPASAAAEGADLWGWGASPPGPTPHAPPAPPAAASEGDPTPELAEDTATGNESSGDSPEAAPPPEPSPEPSKPNVTDETSWRDGWSLFPHTIGRWEINYWGWIFTPVGLAWAELGAQGGILGFCGHLLVGRHWRAVVALILGIVCAGALYLAGTGCQAFVGALAMICCCRRAPPAPRPAVPPGPPEPQLPEMRGPQGDTATDNEYYGSIKNRDRNTGGRPHVVVRAGAQIVRLEQPDGGPAARTSPSRAGPDRAGQPEGP